MIAEERREQLTRRQAEQRDDLDRRGVDDEKNEKPNLTKGAEEIHYDAPHVG